MQLSKSFVEFVGTFFLVLTIGVVVIEPGAGAMAPLAIGSVLTALVYAGGHVSGEHYNPAVTLAALLRGACPASDVAPYVISQCVAAVAAALAVGFFKAGAEVTPIELAVGPALLAEFLFTFALCYVILNVATAKATRGNSYFGLAIGFIVLAGAYAVGTVSGAAFNPAVAIGVTVMGLAVWADIWVYFVAEIGGALAAVIAFRAIVGGS